LTMLMLTFWEMLEPVATGDASSELEVMVVAETSPGVEVPVSRPQNSFSSPPMTKTPTPESGGSGSMVRLIFGLRHFLDLHSAMFSASPTPQTPVQSLDLFTVRPLPSLVSTEGMLSSSNLLASADTSIRYPPIFQCANPSWQTRVKSDFPLVMILHTFNGDYHS
jgi:hypothetical protein